MIDFQNPRFLRFPQKRIVGIARFSRTEISEAAPPPAPGPPTPNTGWWVIGKKLIIMYEISVRRLGARGGIPHEEALRLRKKYRWFT